MLKVVSRERVYTQGSNCDNGSQAGTLFAVARAVASVDQVAEVVILPNLSQKRVGETYEHRRVEGNPVQSTIGNSGL